MSQMNLMKSKINSKINQNILNQALKIIAKKENGQIINSVDDYYGKATNVTTGVKTPAVKRGIGVNFDGDGKIQFIGDDYSCQNAYQKLKNEVESTYKELESNYILQTFINALRQEGVNINEITNTDNGIIRMEGWA